MLEAGPRYEYEDLRRRRKGRGGSQRKMKEWMALSPFFSLR
jgi:hypothetical protein